AVSSVQNGFVQSLELSTQKMSVTIRETNNRQEFESLLGIENYPFTQTFVYGTWHEAMGRRVIRCLAEKDGRIKAAFQAIRFPLVGDAGFLSIPNGPIFSPGADKETVQAVQKKISKLADTERAAFVRLNPIPSRLIESFINTRPAPEATYHSVYAQPQHEWILDLKNKNLEEILSAMHPKMRYNMGLAERHGVTVEIVRQNLKERFDPVFELFQETAKRDNFSLHPKKYYSAIFESGEKYQNTFLAIAKHEGRILAANYVLVHGKEATFIYGGSSDMARNLMAPALIQKNIISELIRRGIERYNLGAVSPEEESSGWGGFSIFKRRLGGHMISRGSSYDIIFKPLWYWAWVAQKFIRNIVQ
ncbi:MAG: peptidoglycan bridge formation glycyltransferase FemA/FemB family protein, partial [Patescibacteria group bacterium]